MSSREMQVEKYVGLPYKANGRSPSGVDCWGLVRLIYKDELQIDLPDLATDYHIDDNARIEDLMSFYREGWDATETISVGDVIVFRVLGADTHVGVAISPTHFIHSRSGRDSAIEPFASGRWNTRIVGSYKYRESGTVVLNGAPHPLRTERVTAVIPPGVNLVELKEWLIEQYQISPEYRSVLHIFVNGAPVPAEMHAYTVLKDSDVVEYRAVPTGGGGMRSILMLVVAVAVAWAVAPVAAGGLGWGSSLGSALGVSAATGTALATIGLNAIGMALVNAIAPVRTPEAMGTTNPGSAERQLMVTGGANRATPYEPIPFVLGRVRMTPPVGSSTYQLFSGDGKESYQRMLLVWGYGPLYVDEATLKIGELPISNYEGVIHETLTRISEPTAGELAIFNGLYGRDITQVNSGVELTCDGPCEDPVTAFATASATYTLPANYKANSLVVTSTASVYDPEMGGYNTTTITVGFNIAGSFVTFAGLTLPYTTYDVSYRTTLTPGPWLDAVSTDGAINDFTIAVHFPQGCRKIASKGSAAGQSFASPVQLQIEFKTVTSGSWFSGGTHTLGTTAAKDAFSWTHRIIYNVGENVQVRIRRLTGTGNAAPVDENYQWAFSTSLVNTTFSRNASPAVDPVNCKIAKTVLEIKASDQLNGQIEGVNAIVQTWGKSWNGSAWVDGVINNPAALFRHVLEHPANPRRVTDAANKINLTQLQYWHTYCASKGFEYNAVVGSQRSVLEILRDICAAGRASPAMIDGKWTVVIDEPRTNIVQHFTAHNSWGFEGAKALPKLPDGLRVNFLNEAKGWQEDEVIVYATASSQSNAALLENISVPGVTKLASAVDHARWHMAQAKLRPEVYTINTDIEYIVCNRGDRVKVMHDVPMWGLGSGRIKNKISTTVLELTESVPVDAGVSYGIRFRAKTGASNERLLQQVLTPTLASRTGGVVTVTTADHPLEVGDSVAVVLAGVSLNSPTATVTATTTDTFSYVLAGSNVSSTAVSGTISLNDGYYSRIKLTAAADATVADNDDLFLFGNYQQESQDCTVLNIEPMGNKSARLTLVDYGVTPTTNIFTDYLNYTNTLTFESQISLPPVLLLHSFGTKVPTITGFISDERVMERVAAGVFAYKLLVSYTNATGLPSTTQAVEFQYDYAAAVDGYGTRTTRTTYNAGSVMITGVEEGEALKVRARYVGSDGRTGLWTAWSNHTIVGKTSPPSNVAGFTATTDSLTGKLNLAWVPNEEIDVKEYEVRTDTSWGSATNRLFVGDASSIQVTSLAAGVASTYYIKALDYSGNYSLANTSVGYTVASPSNVAEIDHTFNDTSTSSATVTLSWVNVTPPLGLSHYEVTYGAEIKTLAANTVTLPANWLGDRTFTVRTVDKNGNESSGLAKTINKALPAAPATFAFIVNGPSLVLDWADAVKTTLPVWGYEVRMNTNFGDANYLFKGSATSCTVPRANITLGTNTYYVKTIDTENEYSSSHLACTYVVAAPGNVASIAHTFEDTSLTSASVTLSWEDVAPVFGLSTYTVTYGAVTRTTKANTITLAADWAGNRTFTVKVVDGLGYASTGSSKVVAKSAPAPCANFRSQVIDNTVMFYWDLPARTTLPVDHVLLKKGATWATATVIGEKKGGFTTQNETQGGTYTYWIAAVDTDNTESTAVSVTTNVGQPPDFVFNDEYVSSFSQTRVSAALDQGGVLLPVNTSETFEQHFNRNMLTYSEDFSNAVWLRESTSTVSVNQTTAPDSTTTADKLVEAATSAGHYAYQRVTVAAGTYTISVYVKQAERQWAAVQIATDTLVKRYTVLVDLATGLAVTTNSTGSPVSPSYSITSVGNGWYRVSVTATHTSGGVDCIVAPSNSATPVWAGYILPSYTGDITKGIYVWGGQTERRDSAGAYTPTTTTAAVWATPQAQITAGYPLYIQPPATVAGYYEETFDYGSILASSKVTLNYGGTIVSGAPDVTPRISVSDDNVTYTHYEGTTSVFALAFRYVRVRITVSDSLGLGLYTLSSLGVRLDSKLINDAGSVAAVSGDALGTIVNFNREFVDVTSLVLSPAGTTPITAVYDFRDDNAASTYAVASNVCTVTLTSHGFITGQNVRLQFASGLGKMGVYTVTSYTTNTFTVAMTVGNTSGNSLVYAESCRVYLFNQAGARVSASVSWAVKGY